MTHSKDNADRDVVARFWRSVDEHDRAAPADSGPVEVVHGFASVATQAEAAPTVGRRRFMQLSGTTIAIPSMAACTRSVSAGVGGYATSRAA